MPTFVTMKWSREQNRRRRRAEYTAEHVNNIKKMLEQSQRAPFRLICLCDDSSGLDEEIEVIKLSEQLRSMVAIPGQNLAKIYLFSKEFRQAVGEDFIFLDLDVVICGDMSDLFHVPHELGILAGTGLWRESIAAVLDREGLPRQRGLRQISALLFRVPVSHLLRFLRRGDGRWCRYNSSLLLIRAAVDYGLWENLPPPEEALQTVAENGLVGTDQAWLHLRYTGSVRILGPDEGMWRHRQLKVRQKFRRLGGGDWAPAGLRLVIFPGFVEEKPWSLPKGQFPWVDEIYPRGAE